MTLARIVHVETEDRFENMAVVGHKAAAVETARGQDELLGRQRLVSALFGVDPQQELPFVFAFKHAVDHPVFEPDAAQVLEAMALAGLRPFGIADAAGTFAGIDDQTVMAAFLECDALPQAAVSAADDEGVEGHVYFVLGWLSIF